MMSHDCSNFVVFLQYTPQLIAYPSADTQRGTPRPRCILVSKMSYTTKPVTVSVQGRFTITSTHVQRSTRRVSSRRNIRVSSSGPSLSTVQEAVSEAVIEAEEVCSNPARKSNDCEWLTHQLTTVPQAFQNILAEPPLCSARKPRPRPLQGAEVAVEYVCSTARSTALDPSSPSRFSSWLSVVWYRSRLQTLVCCHSRCARQTLVLQQ